MLLVLTVLSCGVPGPAEAGESPTPDPAGIERATALCVAGGVEDRLLQCTLAAEAGDINGASLLAEAYRFGWYGAAKNPEAAVRWWKVSAEAGSGVSGSLLGRAYLCGFGVAQNNAEAKRWFQWASEAGRQSGISRNGYLSELGIGGPPDYEAALKWYSIGAELHEADSIFGLGMLYAEGHGVPKDPARAKQLFGDAEEALRFTSALGAGGFSAIGATKMSRDKPPRALEKQKLLTLREVADRGDAEAQYELALSYFNGPGLPLGKTDALHWFERAATQGHSKAQYVAAQMYMRGWGTTTRDFAKAATLFQESLAGGYNRAGFAAGYMLMNGIGVKADVRRGIKLLIAAANAGDEDAQGFLAVQSAQGNGLPPNLEGAKRWWTRKMGCEHFVTEAPDRT